jgi:hypothetical protein
MQSDPLSNRTPAGRQRLVQQLDRMVARRQVTPEEAQQLRAANDPASFDAAVVAIRLRHAGARLTAAVESGQMTQEEADDNLHRLRQGEHPRALRSHLRKLVPKDR